MTSGIIRILGSEVHSNATGFREERGLLSLGALVALCCVGPLQFEYFYSGLLQACVGCLPAQHKLAIVMELLVSVILKWLGDMGQESSTR